MAKVNDMEVPDFRLRGAGLKWRKCATSKILGSPGVTFVATSQAIDLYFPYLQAILKKDRCVGSVYMYKG